MMALSRISLRNHNKVDAGLDRQQSSPGGYKIMLNSTYNDFFLLINVKMPTFVGVSTFMSRKNNIIGLSEPYKS